MTATRATETPTTVLDGLVFPEGARWHEGALYFSDMHDGIVWRLTPGGSATNVLELPTLPSGLGWLPDGTMCVVSMEDRRLLRLTPDGPVTLADLSGVARYVINDMVIDRAGRAYIGTFGCDFNNGDPPRPTQVFCVHPDGRIAIAADGIQFPNGCVITADGRTFIVAETFGECLSAYDINGDGALSNRRVFGGFKGLLPGWDLSRRGGRGLDRVSGGEPDHPDDRRRQDHGYDRVTRARRLRLYAGRRRPARPLHLHGAILRAGGDAERSVRARSKSCAWRFRGTGCRSTPWCVPAVTNGPLCR